MVFLKKRLTLEYLKMKKWLLSAGLLGLTGVMLGAFGAHALKSTLAASGSVGIWETAVFYHLNHSVAMLGISLYAQNRPAENRQWLIRTCICWLLGILLFSGSLYLFALGCPKWLGLVTPLGGIFLLAGWGGVIMDSLITPKPTSA